MKDGDIKLSLNSPSGEETSCIFKLYMYAKAYGSLPGELCNHATDKELRELERYLSGYEHLLIIKRAGTWFTVPI